MVGKYWRGLSYEVKSALAALAVVLVVVAGFFAAAGLTSLESSASEVEVEAVLAETLTVERVVTRSSGGERTVVRTVRVVPRVTETAGVLGTAIELRTITTPRQRDLVTIPGEVRTIVETRGGTTRTSVVTNERVVTDRRVVTNERVVTDQRVVTTDRTITDVRTQQVTVPVTTVRTVTEAVPVTQTVTTTTVLTETVIPPPETLTVTVTCPPKGCG